MNVYLSRAKQFVSYHGTPRIVLYAEFKSIDKNYSDPTLMIINL